MICRLHAQPTAALTTESHSHSFLIITALTQGKRTLSQVVLHKHKPSPLWVWPDRARAMFVLMNHRLILVPPGPLHSVQPQKHRCVVGTQTDLCQRCVEMSAQVWAKEPVFCFSMMERCDPHAAHVKEKPISSHVYGHPDSFRGTSICLSFLPSA